MTNFEKLKNMTQDEAVEYVRNGLCTTYKKCYRCPMECELGCSSDIFADWLESYIIQNDNSEN